MMKRTKLDRDEEKQCLEYFKKANKKQLLFLQDAIDEHIYRLHRRERR